MQPFKRLSPCSFAHKFELLYSRNPLVASLYCPSSWPLFWVRHTGCSAREAAGGMLRTLGQIARLDRRWFRAHPERRHRCRWPDTVELDLWDNNRDARLVMAIRHLGRGHVVYQPVIFQGGTRDRRRRCLRSQRHPPSRFPSSAKWTCFASDAACASTR
jgi:hypothetical protein